MTMAVGGGDIIINNNNNGRHNYINEVSSTKSLPANAAAVVVYIIVTNLPAAGELCMYIGPMVYPPPEVLYPGAVTPISSGGRRLTTTL